MLFCSDTAFNRYSADWLSAAPDLEAVQLKADTQVGQDDIARITMAFFSGDVWPARGANFMRVCLEATNLRWLHTFSAGVDNPIFGMFRDRGVRLTTSSGASARPIAHTVMMQLLALSRDTPAWTRAQQQREWQQRDVADVEGRVLGIVGLGAIGGEVARLANAFGMRVIGMRRKPSDDEPCETWPISRLHELLAIVDDLVLAAPLTSDTLGMIGAAELGMMRPGSHLVNVGRGELIDEAALIDALQSGHLGGAALDVFVTEPLPTDSPLWSLPNVIVTPHSAGTTDLSRHRAALMFTENLGRFTTGQPLINEVT